MPIRVPSYFDPTRQANVPGAIVDIGHVAATFFDGKARVELRVHASAEARDSGARPIDILGLDLGQLLDLGDPEADPPRPPRRFKTLAEFLQSPRFAAAFQAIHEEIYADLLAKHPRLAGGEVMP